MKKYIYNIKKFIFIQVICYGVVTLSTASIPYIQKLFFDSITKEGKEYSLIILILAYAVCKVLESIFLYIDNIYVWKGALEFETSLKKDFFRSIFNYNFEKFSKKDIGEYISIQGNDITELEQDYLEPLIDIIKSINMIIIYGIILFICVDFRIAIVIFLGSIATILVPRFTWKILSEKRNEYLEEMSLYVSTIKDFLQGFKVIQRKTRKNINMEHEKVLNKTKNKRFIYGKLKSLTMMIEDFSMNILSIVTFVITGILLFKGEITVGTGVATLGYVSCFISPINSIMYDINSVSSLKKVKEKVISYINARGEEKPIFKKKFNDKIEFNNVSFTYKDFSLKNIYCSFEKGKKYAIVGHSGSGKSTLINILMSYIKAKDGNVTIDGENLNLIDTSNIIYCINQNEHIFIEDFINNATVFNSYSKDKTNEVISNFDVKMIDSIKSKNNCQLLSGGEKQMLGMIRMLTADTEIFIMDEPFSAVDLKNSKKLQDFLFNLKGKTVIMVTHKLSNNLNEFDEVILMENGEIIKKGTYKEINETEEFKKFQNC